MKELQKALTLENIKPPMLVQRWGKLFEIMAQYGDTNGDRTRFILSRELKALDDWREPEAQTSLREMESYAIYTPPKPKPIPEKHEDPYATSGRYKGD